MNIFMNNRIAKLESQKISLNKRLMLLVKNYLRIIMLKTIQKNILYQIKIFCSFKNLPKINLNLISRRK